MAASVGVSHGRHYPYDRERCSNSIAVPLQFLVFCHLAFYYSPVLTFVGVMSVIPLLVAVHHVRLTVDANHGPLYSVASLNRTVTFLSDNASPCVGITVSRIPTILLHKFYTSPPLCPRPAIPSQRIAPAAARESPEVRVVLVQLHLVLDRDSGRVCVRHQLADYSVRLSRLHHDSNALG